MSETKNIKSRISKVNLREKPKETDPDEWEKLLASSESDVLLDLMVLKVENDIKKGDFEDGGFDCK